MDFPSTTWPALNTITPFSVESMGVAAARSVNVYPGVAASAVFVANRAYYYPFRLYTPQTARRMSVVNGATAAGNLELGIYDAQGNRIVTTGSFAQAGTNVLQDADITDTDLAPGDYFMAIQASLGTATNFGISSADEIANPVILGLQEAAGSFGLPAAATMAINASPRTICMAVHFNTLV